MREYDFDVIIEWDGTAGGDFLDRCEAALKDEFEKAAHPAATRSRSWDQKQTIGRIRS